MITADQLVAHAIGDYILQSDWMAQHKTANSLAALVHALTYTIPFLVFTFDPWHLAFISGTHFVIDRWRLARYLVWLKNFLAPRWMMVADGPMVQHPPDEKHPHPLGWTSTRFRLRHTLPWSSCQKTGYPPDRPDWLTVWLMIIADNICHVLLNGWVLS